MEVEEAYSIALPDRLAERIRTLADLIRIIIRYRKQGPP
jgi:acyl carrier protein